MKPVNGAVASEPARRPRERRSAREREDARVEPTTGSPDEADRANLLRYMAMMRAAEERGDHPLPAGQDPRKLLRRLRPGGDLGRLLVRARPAGPHVHPAPRPRRPLRPRASPRTATSPTTWAAAGGVTGGKDGNMHFGDRELGCVGMVSMLPDMALVATGMALAFKLRGEPRVAMTYFGEGSTANGQWHEAMNFAGVHKLPVVFMLENNGFAYSTPNELEFAVDPVERAATYGFPGVLVDGNDVEAVFEASRDAAERARAGGGPTLIECRTMRMHGHGAHDDMSYVPDRACARSGPSATRSSATPSGSWPSTASPPTRSSGSAPRSRPTSTSARRRRSPRRCPTRRCAAEGVFADDVTPLGDGQAPWSLLGERRRREERCLMAEMTYLEAISDGLREEMRRDESVFCMGQDIGNFGGAFKVTDGFIEEFGADARARHAAGRERDHRHRRRRRGRGPAAGLRDAVRRLHRLRLRPAGQRRREAPLPPGRRGADGGPPALRRRLLRRPVPLPEPGGLVPAVARPEGRRAGDRRRRQGPADGGDPRPEPGLLPRAQGPLPLRQGRGARGRVRRSSSARRGSRARARR